MDEVHVVRISCIDAVHGTDIDTACVLQIHARLGDTRMYKLPKGYLAAAHDLHEGIKVAYADQPDGLPKAFENPLVREFLEDELRFRKIVGAEHART